MALMDGKIIRPIEPVYVGAKRAALPTFGYRKSKGTAMYLQTQEQDHCPDTLDTMKGINHKSSGPAVSES